MNRWKLIFKKIWFGISNFIFLRSISEFNVLFWLNEQNKSNGNKWVFYSFFINITPFLVAVIIQNIISPDEVLTLINNGTLPVLSFSIIATNFIYLIENISSDRDIYYNIKSNLTGLSIILVLVSSILYILQSNFVTYFNDSNLNSSFIFSLIVLFFSLVVGKKMFLIQNKFISDFEKRFKNQMDSLQTIPQDNDINF